MRTTVTLDPDVDAAVRRLMRERRLSFKDAVNTAIRAGLSKPRRQPFVQPTYDMGTPLVPLEKALQLAGELEDAELKRRLAARK
ncbi:MAG: antitoxin [Gaiellaceae bacterium]